MPLDLHHPGCPSCHCTVPGLAAPSPGGAKPAGGWATCLCSQPDSNNRLRPTVRAFTRRQSPSEQLGGCHGHSPVCKAKHSQATPILPAALSGHRCPARCRVGSQEPGLRSPGCCAGGGGYQKEGRGKRGLPLQRVGRTRGPTAAAAVQGCTPGRTSEDTVRSQRQASSWRGARSRTETPGRPESTCHVTSTSS